MKKLITICLLVAMAFTANAQESGPTKEQTVEYIKAYFSELKVYMMVEGDSRKVSDNYNFEINGNEVRISCKYYKIFEKENIFHYDEIVKFSLNEIEAISIINYRLSGCHCLYFYAASKKKIIIDEINYATGERGVETHNFCEFYMPLDVDPKLAKAFNHLRKLCGAPEPISFD